MYRPKSVVNEIWPATQLGVEGFGALPGTLPAPWLLEWHAYVSNGRTPGPVDPTTAKMIGGRVKASTTRPYPMSFGAAAMMGEYSDQEHNFDIITGKTSRPEVIAYAEQGGALDASLDLGALRVRSELTVRHLDYEEGKREPAWFPASTRPTAWSGTPMRSPPTACRGLASSRTATARSIAGRRSWEMPRSPGRAGSTPTSPRRPS
jgi:hypothetical protein